METKFNFNSAICTNRQQSERLLALGLKKETADMIYPSYTDMKSGKLLKVSDTPVVIYQLQSCYDFPGWSLHRLIEMCPYVIRILPALHLTMTSDSVFYCTEDNNEDYEKSFSRYANMYDNYIECIAWLIKEGYFNKEYLEDGNN